MFYFTGARSIDDIGDVRLYEVRPHCQTIAGVNLRCLHLIKKFTDTQVEADVSESSPHAKEVFLPGTEDNKEEATEAAASPKVSTRKIAFTFPQNRKIQMIRTCKDQTTNTKGK